MSKKIIAYGMDGFITPMMKHFADEGSLPTFKRLIDDGAVDHRFDLGFAADVGALKNGG